MTNRLHQVDIKGYARTRNALSGAVTKLSPYLRHGLLTDRTFLAQIKESNDADQAVRLIQQLSWRSYFHQVHSAQPHRIWQDAEPYKTGWQTDDYARTLPDDIARGQTGIRIIDQLIDLLLTEGYLHNRARLYLASYIVHWRQVAWQAGARWFLQHLLDGDIASNNHSWQWVASTFSNKPYIFNLDNVRQFADNTLDVDHPSNACFDASYEQLQWRLFPNLTPEGT
ncbi:MAG: FAD-binding domain-containing protein [Hydrogenovibrio sp.]|uniref:FAD-binding domain-containing protein n=1 Tax=Hydrogenovibrio sp. TaxID=2065821 RepID=UPI00286FCC33|nr:FAD-binding domain-containing protein [Hydrogenovibrio sp.]MDR9499973.1 FAD-binding domain-containing protein [Hydrogenovibrio sp.]